MSVWVAVPFLVVAGVGAGVLGTAGAITSLVSYPALLAAGVPALAANVVNIVAGTALWPGSALASGPELGGRGPWLARQLPWAALGSAIGVTLLLVTPADRFRAIVPFLVALGSLALLLSPVLTRHRRDRPSAAGRWLGPMIALVSIYSGYFGAGSGVMTLAVVLIGAAAELPTANALKNMLIGAGSVIASIALIVLAPVDWTATVALAAGMLIGSTLGPRVARRLSPGILRPTAAAFGFGLAVWLWLSR